MSKTIEWYIQDYIERESGVGFGKVIKEVSVNKNYRKYLIITLVVALAVLTGLIFRIKIGIPLAPLP